MRRCPYCQEPLPHPENVSASWAFVYSDVLAHLRDCVRRPDGDEHEAARTAADDLTGFFPSLRAGALRSI